MIFTHSEAVRLGLRSTHKAVALKDVVDARGIDICYAVDMAKKGSPDMQLRWSAIKLPNSLTQVKFSEAYKHFPVDEGDISLDRSVYPLMPNTGMTIKVIDGAAWYTALKVIYALFKRYTCVVTAPDGMSWLCVATSRGMLVGEIFEVTV